MSATSDATVSVVSSGPLTISPTSIDLAIDDSALFTAAGGTPPYSFALISGVGSVNSATGQYLAPSVPGIATVRITDNIGGTADATVSVTGAGCGQTFNEVEPNDDVSPPWTLVDRQGIVLAPNCVVHYDGITDTSGDTLEFDTGTATSIIFAVTWSTGTNAANLFLFDDAGMTLVTAASGANDQEIYLWTVDVPNAMRYVRVTRNGGAGVPFTMMINPS